MNTLPSALQKKHSPLVDFISWHGSSQIKFSTGILVYSLFTVLWSEMQMIMTYFWHMKAKYPDDTDETPKRKKKYMTFDFVHIVKYIFSNPIVLFNSTAFSLYLQWPDKAITEVKQS